MPRGRRADRRSPAPPESANKRSIRLTVKAPPSRLREIKSTSPEQDPKPKRETLSRSSKNKSPIVDPPSDEDEEEEEDEEADEEEREDDDEEQEDDEDDEAEEEDDEDSPMPDAPSDSPMPRIKLSGPSSLGNARKLTPTQALKQAHPRIKSVEEKEMQSSRAATSSQEDNDGADSSSEPNEDGEEEEDEDVDEEEDEDANEEGQPPPPDLSALQPPSQSPLPADDRADTIKAEELHSSDLDTDSSELEDGSRSGTPDLSKLTRRQRAGLTDDGSLMALSNEAQKKKFFTAEQITMRRAEMARRRKDLSDKRNQEEKEDTLKRLLEKPAPKRRSRAQMIADAEREEFGGGREDGEEGAWAMDRTCVRTVVGRGGTRVCVPDDWLGAPVGELFRRGRGEDGRPVLRQGMDGLKVVKPGRMVEVVE